VPRKLVAAGDRSRLVSSSGWGCGNWDVLEDAVVRDEGHPKSDGGRGDPSVTVVDLVAKSMADPLAVGP